MELSFEMILASFTWRDAAALALFAVCVNGVTMLIERTDARRPSVGRLMARHRERWMSIMAEREVRIVDSTLLSILHQGTGFFASACLIAIGGLAALIGSADQLMTVAADFSAGEATRGLWELKLLFLLILLVLALLRFIWALRLFGYCAVLIGATPEADTDNDRQKHAAKAAVLNIRAGRSFNRGLRMVYFALAALSWLIGPVTFMAATLTAAAMLCQREFFSETRRVLSEDSEAETP